MKLNYIIVLIVGLLVIMLCSPLWAQEMILNKAVIHHTASHDVSAATIDEWHKERGWDGIAYHFVVRASGAVELGRNLRKKGAHARGRNNYIGIVLTGRDIFTSAQTRELTRLLKRLKITHIERHHEQCPGEGLNLDKIRYD